MLSPTSIFGLDIHEQDHKFTLLETRCTQGLRSTPEQSNLNLLSTMTFYIRIPRLEE